MNNRIEPQKNPLHGLVSYEDYKVVEILIEKLSMPQKKSLKEIAEEINVKPQKVYNLIAKPEIKKMIQSNIDTNGISYEAMAWQSLAELVEAGDLSAIKFFFELQGKYQSGNRSGSSVFIQNNANDTSRIEEKLNSMGEDFLKKLAHSDSIEEDMKKHNVRLSDGDNDE